MSCFRAAGSPPCYQARRLMPVAELQCKGAGTRKMYTRQGCMQAKQCLTMHQPSAGVGWHTTQKSRLAQQAHPPPASWSQALCASQAAVLQPASPASVTACALQPGAASCSPVQSDLLQTGEVLAAVCSVCCPAIWRLLCMCAASAHLLASRTSKPGLHRGMVDAAYCRVYRCI